MRKGEENRVRFPRHLCACESRHIRDPCVVLNSRYIVYYWLKTYEPRSNKCLYVSRDLLIELKRLESAIWACPTPLARLKKINRKLVESTKKITFISKKKLFFKSNLLCFFFVGTLDLRNVKKLLRYTQYVSLALQQTLQFLKQERLLFQNLIRHL